MTKQDAEKITTEYLKPIYGFTLKRCRNLQDAEDLTQDIVLKVFRALLKRDDITDVPGFVWTVAHNCLVNYYRDKRYAMTELSADEVSVQLPDGTDMESEFIRQEEIVRLRREIAYLSKLQREIVVAYYFENKRQNQIAEEMGIPTGSVKWHLFEAKNLFCHGGERRFREDTELRQRQRRLRTFFQRRKNRQLFPV